MVRNAAPAVALEQRESTFGDLLRRLRERAGLTQEELAERAGLTAHGISALERGVRRRPYPHTVRALADALNATESERIALLAAARRSTLSVAYPPATPVTGQAPVPLTPLIGRDADIGQAERLLFDEAVRLLTLTGPGGVGKTRLALEIATRAETAFADGFLWIPLDALRDWRLVASVIGHALGLQEGGGLLMVELLKLHLRDRELLLVLDNFEHLLPAAPVVVELLAASPRVKALVTSRARLGVTGEHLLRIAPLGVPDPRHARRPDQVAASPAVQLFLARARAVDPGLPLTEANAPVIAQICAKLDGLPLALELAAARIGVLSPQALLARLSDRLTLLTGGARDQPDRLRMIRLTIAWSYDLLTPEEQALFRRLSVFAGGFTLEAAEAVAGQPEEKGAEGRSPSVLDGLSALVANSLIQRDDDEDATPRFRMLETIRDYGMEQLQLAGEAEDARQRHAAWCLSLLLQADAELDGPDQIWWLNRIEREHANVRIALGWLRERGAYAEALPLAAAMSRFWWLHGHYSEGRSHLEPLLNSTDARAHPVAWAGAMTGLGALLHKQGHYDRAVETHESAVAAWREIGDQKGLGRALWALGFTLLSRASDRAEAVFQEGLQAALAAGDEWGAGASVWGLARIARFHDDLQRAREMLEPTLARARAIGNPLAIAVTLLALAEVAQDSGEVEREADLLARALPLFRAMQEQWGMVGCLEGAAAIAAARHRPTDAARLFGAATALRETLGMPRPIINQAPYERTLATARSMLPASDFAAAWQEGQAMTLDEAITRALADIRATSPGAP
ncbi:MAG TPA: helix-turn-helix domain-containing protein [Thermomicrobiales bacterium]